AAAVAAARGSLDAGPRHGRFSCSGRASWAGSEAMPVADVRLDAEADATILACLDLSKPRRFFLYAGAGSGKTRSLVSAVRKTSDGEHGRQLTLTGKNVVVSTYTSDPCDDSKQRLDCDPRVPVMTNHASSWSLHASYTVAVRQGVD
ncbi:hypothetical protein ACU7M0_38330, partial [Burkholderia cenocepacia]